MGIDGDEIWLRKGFRKEWEDADEIWVIDGDEIWLRKGFRKEWEDADEIWLISAIKVLLSSKNMGASGELASGLRVGYGK